MSKHHFTWLALGDSYTIGEGLPLHECYPYQALQLLRQQGISCQAPEIVAQTGWTSFELAEHLIHHQMAEHYDAVSLLIGVNNQYRGLQLADYAAEFEFLLKKGIHLAGGHTERVFVLSIPDWGVTPFATDRTTTDIASEIDAFNAAVAKGCANHGVKFVDVTEHYRSVGGLPQGLAPDQLHPSAKVYAHWAQLLGDLLAPIARQKLG